MSIDGMSDDKDTPHYDGPAAGWGSVGSMARIMDEERPPPAVLDTLRRQNKSGGFMCVSCAWAKPARPHTFEFCENGAKATIWELTGRRCTPDFIARHTAGFEEMKARMDAIGWQEIEEESGLTREDQKQAADI